MRAWLLMVLILGMNTAAAAIAMEPTTHQISQSGLLMLVRAQAATLIMVDDPACQYCRRWNKEVGGGYGRTAEGRAAPLKRVGRDSKALADFAPVVYTPTFILVRDGREVGRITGYPGQFYFWEELSQLMSSAGITTEG